MPQMLISDKYYFNKNTMTTYIYSLDENHIVKINMNDKYNIIYSEDEILKMLIKKYKKIIIRASSNITNLAEFIKSLDNEITYLQFELPIICDSCLQLDKMPYHLTTLSIICEKLVVPLNNLPPTLVKLQIKTVQSYDFPLERLPITLQILYLETEYNKPLYNLPPYLQILLINEITEPETLSNLPNELKKLCLVKFYIFKFNNLPNSLEEIIFPDRLCISFNKFVYYEYKNELKKDYPKLKWRTQVTRSFLEEV